MILYRRLFFVVLAVSLARSVAAGPDYEDPGGDVPMNAPMIPIVISHSSVMTVVSPEDPGSLPLPFSGGWRGLQLKTALEMPSGRNWYLSRPARDVLPLPNLRERIFPLGRELKTDPFVGVLAAPYRDGRGPSAPRFALSPHAWHYPYVHVIPSSVEELRTLPAVFQLESRQADELAEIFDRAFGPAGEDSDQVAQEAYELLEGRLRAVQADHQPLHEHWLRALPSAQIEPFLNCFPPWRNHVFSELHIPYGEPAWLGARAEMLLQRPAAVPSEAHRVLLALRGSGCLKCKRLPLGASLRSVHEILPDLLLRLADSPLNSLKEDNPDEWLSMAYILARLWHSSELADLARYTPQELLTLESSDDYRGNRELVSLQRIMKRKGSKRLLLGALTQFLGQAQSR